MNVRKVILILILKILVEFIIETALIAIMLWLISCIFPYNFSWIHALAGTGIVMILRLLFYKSKS